MEPRYEQMQTIHPLSVPTPRENKSLNAAPVDEEFELKSIESKLRSDELEIEKRIADAEELSNLVGSALKEKIGDSLNREEGKGKGNIIFIDQFPDLLNAQARLLALSIDGRSKVSVMRKSRYAILNAAKNSSSDDELSLKNLLSD